MPLGASDYPTGGQFGFKSGQSQASLGEPTPRSIEISASDLVDGRTSPLGPSGLFESTLGLETINLHQFQEEIGLSEGDLHSEKIAAPSEHGIFDQDFRTPTPLVRGDSTPQSVSHDQKLVK